MPNAASYGQNGNQHLMGFDESQCTDLIYPHRVMGWQSKWLTFVVEQIWIDNIYKVQEHIKREY